MEEKIKFYQTYHGLHVIDNVYVKNCEQCKQRAILKSVAVFLNLDPEKVSSDAIWASKLIKNVGNLK